MGLKVYSSAGVWNVETDRDSELKHTPILARLINTKAGYVFYLLKGYTPNTGNLAD